MHKRKQPTVLFVLVLATVTLLGYAQLWSGDCNTLTPTFTTTVIEDNIKVVSGCNGKTIAVYFWKDDCTPSASDDCWEQVQPQKGEICTCAGSDCVDDLSVNIERHVANNSTKPPDDLWKVNLQCHLIKQAGAGAQGCAVYSNPRYYVTGGDVYSRN